ncbi:hypothetical protein V6243_07165 [Cobetia marina]|uniref:Uncharacterized protein n=1 Tax=Cobetia marina TaxID=28258 RepID=A0ABU9GEE6_COBMA
MSYTKYNLPKSYLPYEELVICSNVLLGGGHVVSIGDVLPVIIGSGEKPQVWLQVVLNNKKNEFVSIVENSVSKHPDIEVLEMNGVMTVSIKGKSIISVRAVSESKAIVDSMDLRPIGLNMYGDSSSMNVGGNTFAGNRMFGGGILLGLAQ